MRFLEVVAGGLSVTDAAVGQTGNLCDSTSLSIGAAAVHAGGPKGSSSYSMLTLWVVVVETLNRLTRFMIGCLAKICVTHLYRVFILSLLIVCKFVCLHYLLSQRLDKVRVYIYIYI